jgi:hypothetical protein
LGPGCDTWLNPKHQQDEVLSEPFGLHQALPNYLFQRFHGLPGLFQEAFVTKYTVCLVGMTA